MRDQNKHASDRALERAIQLEAQADRIMDQGRNAIFASTSTKLYARAKALYAQAENLREQSADLMGATKRRDLTCPMTAPRTPTGCYAVGPVKIKRH